MNKKLAWLPLFALLLALPISTSAFTVKTEESIYLPKEQAIDGNLYLAGQNIVIDSPVSGDVIGFGQTVTVNAPISGDLIMAGQSFNINAPIGGSIRIAGNSLMSNNRVSHNLQALAKDVVLGADSWVGWDAFVNVGTIDARGHIEGSLHGNTGKATVSGTVGRDVNLNISDNSGQSGMLAIEKNAKIDGRLIYSASKIARNDGFVRGEIMRQETKASAPSKKAGIGLLGFFFSLFAAIIVAMVILKVSGKSIYENYRLYRGHSLETTITGLIALISLPLTALLLIITFIGAPLGLITMALWLIALYVSQIIVGIHLGAYLASEIKKRKDWNLFKGKRLGASILGIAIIWLASQIPFLGWPIRMAVMVIGLGFFWLLIKKHLENK